MEKPERTPLWASLLWALVWVLLLLNIASDYFLRQRITPFSMLMLVALLLGSTVVLRLLNQPNFSRSGMRERIILTGGLLLIVLAYVLARILF